MMQPQAAGYGTDGFIRERGPSPSAISTIWS